MINDYPNGMRDEKGRFVEKNPPLLNLTINNPLAYLKRWWTKVMGNEGVDIKFRIHPLTAIAMAVSIGGLSFGLGRLTFPEPIVRYIPQLGTPIPTASPNPWRETAYTGVLRQTQTTQRFFLETTSGEAITLEVPANINMVKLIGKRIFAGGNYNEVTKILYVTESQDLEILPSNIVPLPTLSPTPTPVS